MYMGPISRAKAPAKAPVRRSAGTAMLLVSALVMLPWLAGYVLFAGAALVFRLASKAPRALLDMIDYAGTVALGR